MKQERRKQLTRIGVLLVIAVALGGMMLVRDVLSNDLQPVIPPQPSLMTPVVLRTPTPRPPTPAQPLEVTEQIPTASIAPGDISRTETPTIPAPIAGSFDVYLGPPDSKGYQRLQIVDIARGRIAHELTIRPDDGQAMLAGKYVYFLEHVSRRPMRVNTAGGVEPVPFIELPSGMTLVQLLPSLNGDWLAWTSADAAGRSYTIERSMSDGALLRQIAEGDVAPGTRVRLLRVTNIGDRVFLLKQPVEEPGDRAFPVYNDMLVANILLDEVEIVPSHEPCDADVKCAVHVSPDGAFVARTAPVDLTPTPITVVNLISGTVIARFRAPVTSLGQPTEVGYPLFTPGGALIYMAMVPVRDETHYMLILANIVTEEQEVIADLGVIPHRPLRWTGEGFHLLTTRMPDYYDTWQIDIRDGTIKNINDLMYLGHIEQPELPSLP